MTTDRKGDWIQTYTGKCFWPLDPRPEEVHIEDIAHALSRLCRFGGHCGPHYSVAEHSVYVSENVSPKNALWGLLHDAAEAYTADIPRPLKKCFPEWRPIEAKVMEAVCLRFGLPPEQPEDVSTVDGALLGDERAALMLPCERDWGYSPEPLGVQIQVWSPDLAKTHFLRRFWELTS